MRHRPRLPGEGDDRRPIPSRSDAPVRARQLRHQARHFLTHDHRDHLEGGGIAHPCDEEQSHEAGEEAAEAAVACRESNHAKHTDDHADEHPEGDPPAAPPVGDPARAGAADRADQRPEEHVLQRVDVGELRSWLSSGKPAE